MPYQVHVGQGDELDGLVDAASDQFGKVDTLINNAGTSPLDESLTSVTEKLFDAVINLNLKRPFRLSSLVGERMVEAGRGSIITSAPLVRFARGPSSFPIPQAKAGLNALTQALASAYGPRRGSTR